jgi:hypothetical protein
MGSMGFGRLNAEVSCDPALTRVAPSDLFVVRCLCASTGMESWNKGDRVTREISEVTGRLGFCKFRTWSSSVRYNPFVCETDVELFYFFINFYWSLKHVQNKQIHALITVGVTSPAYNIQPLQYIDNFSCKYSNTVCTFHVRNFSDIGNF